MSLVCKLPNAGADPGIFERGCTQALYHNILGHNVMYSTIELSQCMKVSGEIICKLEFSTSYNIVTVNLSIILIFSNNLLQFERFCLEK